jgi:DNA-binding beta-propeller fold protein YncE
LPDDNKASRILMLIEKSSHCLSFYDTEAGVLLDSIALPEYPHEFVVDAAEQYAYVGHYGVKTSTVTDVGGSSVFVIDIANRRLERTIDCRPFRRLHGVGFDAQDRLHVLSETDAVLLRFDEPRTATGPSRGVPSGGLKSHLFALTLDGKWAYCMNLLSHTVTKVSPMDASIPPVVLSPGDKPEGIFLTPDEKTLYVSNRLSHTLVAISTDTMAIRRTAPSRKDPARIYGMPNGQLLVANYANRSVSIVDAETLEETHFLELPGQPAAACIQADSNTAIVAVDSNQCIRIDLSSLSIIGAFQTKLEPDCCFVLGGRKD